MKAFLYQDADALQIEFERAKVFFEQNPSETKISRKDWPTITPNGEYIPLHSYLKREDGQIIAIAHGEGRVIGQGHSGRVKLALGENGQLFALKIETSNNARQQCETAIAEDVKVMEGGKASRVGGKRKDTTKYYSTLYFLGNSLKNILDTRTDIPTPSLPEKIIIARKLAWAVAKLHLGKSSISENMYFHGDIKPDNIVLDDEGNLHLIDFGLSQVIDDSSQEVPLRGSPEYLPNCRRQSELQIAMNKLGYIGVDNYALRTTLYSNKFQNGRSIFSRREIETLPKRTRNSILLSRDVNRAIYEVNSAKNKPFQLVTRLIESEMQTLLPNLNLDALSYEEALKICECFELVDICSNPSGPALTTDEANAYKLSIVQADEKELSEIQAELESRIGSHEAKTSPAEANIDKFNALKQLLHDETGRNSLDDDLDSGTDSSIDLT